MDYKLCIDKTRKTFIDALEKWSEEYESYNKKLINVINKFNKDVITKSDVKNFANDLHKTISKWESFSFKCEDFSKQAKKVFDHLGIFDTEYKEYAEETLDNLTFLEQRVFKIGEQFKNLNNIINIFINIVDL